MRASPRRDGVVPPRTVVSRHGALSSAIELIRGAIQQEKGDTAAITA
jgi:hypothetical protein